MKDRWNREVEGLVRTAQTTDWEAVRIRWENRIKSAFDSLRSTEKAQELEQKFQENVVDPLSNPQLLKESIKEAVGGKRILEENVGGTGSNPQLVKDSIREAVGGKRILDEDVGGTGSSPQLVKESIREAVGGKRILDEK